MNKTLIRGLALLVLGAGSALPPAAMASVGPMPGDTGKPGQDGVMPANGPPQAPNIAARITVPAPPSDMAVRIGQAIASACRQYPLGVAVVNANGQPIVVYLPDGSDPHHAYMAIRKAYSAVMFKANTSTLVTRAQQDPALAAQIKADPNLVSYSGGILLRSGGQIIGAVGVSGSEPGHHDEECGMTGMATIRDLPR